MNDRRLKLMQRIWLFGVSPIALLLFFFPLNKYVWTKILVSPVIFILAWPGGGIALLGAILLAVISPQFLIGFNSAIGPAIIIGGCVQWFIAVPKWFSSFESRTAYIFWKFWEVSAIVLALLSILFNVWQHWFSKFEPVMT
jgi:hypothetical protein